MYNYDSVLYGRWEYWSNLQLVPQEKDHFLIENDPDKRLKNIQKHILPPEPIPEISFSNGCASSRDKSRQMLELCLDKMLTKGGYISMITRIEYLLDWLLFTLGHPYFGELPPEPRSCEGCSMVLYQLFNLFPVWYLYCPWFAMPPFYLVDRTDLMWGNSLAEPDRENAPVSIHQKYWREQYRDIYPVGLLENDWREEIRKIIDLQPTPVTAPKIQQPKIEDDLIQPDKPTKPKGFKRAKSKKKSKSLF